MTQFGTAPGPHVIAAASGPRQTERGPEPNREEAGRAVPNTDMQAESRSAGPIHGHALSILCVRGLAAAVEQAGVSRTELLRVAGFAPSELAEATARISFERFSRLCHVAMELTDDPALGLHWAEREGARNLAPVTHMLVYAPCLRHALEAIVRFEPLLSDARVFQLLESGDKVVLRCLPLEGAVSSMQIFWAAIGMAGIFRLIRFYVPGLRPDRVTFLHAAPAHQAEYTRIFGVEVAFEQPHTEIVFDRALLDATSRLQDDGLRNALQSLAERRALHLAQPSSYALRIREFLMRQERPYRTGMQAVASAFGISPRTLHRRLASEGSSYRDIENEALRLAAMRLLRDRRRTIQEAAHAMGFSATSTFHRVFKNWTGMTPRDYRQSVATATDAPTE